MPKLRPHDSSLTRGPALFDKLREGLVPMASLNWRDILLRDVERVLNDGIRSATMVASGLEYAERSVLNHGLPPFARVDSGIVDPHGWALQLQRILRTHEPRLIPQTIRVVPVVHGDGRHMLALIYEISGTLRSADGNLALRFRIALDYSCRSVQIVH